MTAASPLLASVELGGTKVICAVGDRNGTILDSVRIDTTAPQATSVLIDAALDDLQQRHGPFSALGVAAFGPVELDRSRRDYGVIGNTPKPLWRGVNLNELFSSLQVPLALSTDVGTAALAEAMAGAGQDAPSIAYVTVGTGIGAALCVDGEIVVGSGHSEAGHMFCPRGQGDSYDGGCPAHGGCIEGMAAGPAIKARWGTSLDAVAAAGAIDIIAHYIAHLVVNLTLVARPHRIVMGGGVMDTPSLLSRVCSKAAGLVYGYIDVVQSGGWADYIVPCTLRDAGLAGGLIAAGRLEGKLR